MSTIEIIKGNINHNTNKHINRQFNYTSQRREHDYLKIIHCPTEEMIADLLTKALLHLRFSNYTIVLLDQLSVLK